MLFYSFFKTLVGQTVTVEMKNDIQIVGKLVSVDQYLNIKLEDIEVKERHKYPHLASISSCFVRGSVVRYVHIPAASVDTVLLQDAARKEHAAVKIMGVNLLPIESLNAITADRKVEFLTSINLLFEAAPPLVDFLLSKRPFESYAHLIDVAEAAILSSTSSPTYQQIIPTNESDQIFTREQLLEIINAHPRIGAPKTGMSAMSQREQQSQENGEDEKLVLNQLKRLNEEYEQKFGFKFIVFVNGRPKKDLVPVLESRLSKGSVQGELQTGLTEMMAIARDRLKKMQQHNPY